MSAIRNVASSGRTVMVTIHQPSIEIFESFDTLLLLQRGGRTTYFGPLGQESSMLVAYLQAVPGEEEHFFLFSFHDKTRLLRTYLAWQQS